MRRACQKGHQSLFKDLRVCVRMCVLTRSCVFYFFASNLAISFSSCELLFAGNLRASSGDFFGFMGRGGGVEPGSLEGAVGGVGCVANDVAASLSLADAFLTGTDGCFCECVCSVCVCRVVCVCVCMCVSCCVCVCACMCVSCVCVRVCVCVWRMWM